MPPPNGEYVTLGPSGINDTGLPLLPSGPDWSRTSSAAYGSVPAPVQPQITGPANTAAAITAGNQVNAQLPGYGADLATVGQNISSDLAGTVSPDVEAELQQTAAEQGLSTGGASGAAYLKSLGLTSLGLEQTGQQDLQSILTSLPGAAISQNPNFYPTTGQQLDAGQQNSVWASAPDPTAAAQAGLAATQAGFGAGAGSGGVRLPPTPSLDPFGFGAGASAGSTPFDPYDTSSLPTDVTYPGSGFASYADLVGGAGGAENYAPGVNDEDLEPEPMPAQ
jgi:hypothetical protein